MFSINRFRTMSSRDSGSAIIAVIGTAVVMLIIGVTVANLSVRALAFSSSTRASIQSKAAAESGVNVAAVDLRKGNCAVTAKYSQTTTPAYSAIVTYSTSATGNTWVSGCPIYADPTVKRIKIVSTGSAKSVGVAGDSSGDSGFVEAIYPYTPAVLPGVKPTGPAMYFYGGVAFDNNANLIVSAGGPPAIQVKSGNVSCSNNTVIQGDVVIQSGSLSISSCTVQGNAWVGGIATLGTITGNLTSANAFRPPGVTLLWTKNGLIPPVPNWVAFGDTLPALWPTIWIDSSSVAFTVLPIGPDCALSPLMMSTVAALAPASVIINALGCSSVTASNTVTLSNDVVIYAPRFDLSNSNNVTFKSSSTTQRKLWFITPDVTHTNPPSCNSPAQGDFTIKNSFSIDNTVAAMLYTPCQFVAKNTFTWTGQIYANGSTNAFKNNTGFTYVGLGLPGVNLNDGTTNPGDTLGSPATLKTITSLRDVNSGG
jgi:Tfp pilus assembly protein PilX